MERRQDSCAPRRPPPRTRRVGLLVPPLPRTAADHRQGQDALCRNDLDTIGPVSAPDTKDPKGCWAPNEELESARQLVESAGLRYLSEPYIGAEVRRVVAGP